MFIILSFWCIAGIHSSAIVATLANWRDCDHVVMMQWRCCDDVVTMLWWYCYDIITMWSSRFPKIVRILLALRGRKTLEPPAWRLSGENMFFFLGWCKNYVVTMLWWCCDDDVTTLWRCCVHAGVPLAEVSFVVKRTPPSCNSAIDVVLMILPRSSALGQNLIHGEKAVAITM